MQIVKDIKRVKKVLSEVLKEKEDNLIKLYFDWYFRFKKYPDLEERIKKVEKELDKLREARKKTIEIKEKILLLEKELRDMREVSNDLASIGETIKIATDLVETLKDCIKHPEKILAYEKYKKTIHSKHR